METVRSIDKADKGQRLIVQGIVKISERRKTNKEPFLSCTLTNNNGTVYFTIWHESKMYAFFKGLEEGDGVRIDGIMAETSPVKRVDLNTAVQVDIPEYTKINRTGLKKELGQIIRKVQDEKLQQLLKSIFRREDILEGYFKAPLGLMSGGSFRGGVVAFVVRLCKLIDTNAKMFDNWKYNVDGVKVTVNTDILKVAAMIEPIGKLFVFEMQGEKPVKTKTGELLTHQVITMQILTEELMKSELSDDTKLLLTHLVASAGKEEWGALVTERSREAVFFNHLWDLTLQMMHFEHMDRNKSERNPEYASLFGKKRFYLGQYQGEKEEPAAETEPAAQPEPNMENAG